MIVAPPSLTTMSKKEKSKKQWAFILGGFNFLFKKWHSRASTCTLLTWIVSFDALAVTASVVETVNKERGLRPFRPASLQHLSGSCLCVEEPAWPATLQLPTVKAQHGSEAPLPPPTRAYSPLFLRENGRETLIWSWDTKWMSSPQMGLLTSEETEILSTGQIRACLLLSHSLLSSSRFVILVGTCEKS